MFVFYIKFIESDFVIFIYIYISEHYIKYSIIMGFWYVII